MMTPTNRLTEFIATYKASIARDVLWQKIVPDPPPSDAAIQSAERLLHAILPIGFKTFIKEMGGGVIGYTVVYSIGSSQSVYDIVDKNNERSFRKLGLVAFSDDGCGNYYGFKVQGGKCSEQVFLWDHDKREIAGPVYDEFISYLSSNAFE